MNKGRVTQSDRLILGRALTSQEITEVVMRSATFKERAQTWVSARIADVTQGRPAQLAGPAYLIVHGVPLAASPNLLPITTDSLKTDFLAARCSPNREPRYNMDGIYAVSDADKPALYMQHWFDDGRFEWATSLANSPVPGQFVEEEGAAAAFSNISCLRKFTNDSPWLLWLTLHNVANTEYQLIQNRPFRFNGPPRFDRQTITPPPAFVSEATAFDAFWKIVAPIFHRFAQAANWNGSPFFNDDGSRRKVRS